MIGRLRECAGFTLVEIGVALVVIGLLAATMTPAIARYIHDYRLEGAASNLVGELHLIRHKAVTEGNDYIMRINPNTDSYTILDDDNNNGKADSGENIIGPVQLPGGLQLRNGPHLPFPNDTIILKPNGTANNTGMITVASRKGKERNLFIVKSTGFAKKLWEHQSYYNESN